MADINFKAKLLYTQNTRQNHADNIIKLDIAHMDQGANICIRKL